MKNLFKKTINKGLLKSLCVPEEGVLPFFKEYAESQRILDCAFESPIYEYLEFISTEFDNYKMLYKYGEKSFREYMVDTHHFFTIPKPYGCISVPVPIKTEKDYQKEDFTDSLDDTTGEEDDNAD